MLIDNAATKLQFGHHQHPRTEHHGAVKFLDNRSEIGSQRYRESGQQDRLKLSDAARLAATQKNPVDMEKTPDAKHALNIQIIRSLVKSITGQDLQLVAPQALQDRTDQVTVQEPTQAPDSTANNDSGLVYRQSMAYFESQTVAFNAQGSINTKDGQSVNFTVSLSMSHILYRETNLSLSGTDAAGGSPLTVDFEGNASELTSTHFEFSIDIRGSQGQVDASNSNNIAQEPVSISAETGNGESEPAGQSAAGGVETQATQDVKDRQLIGMVKFVYQQLRIWQRHADGSQQLLALGEKHLGALYLGHLTAPLLPDTADTNPVSGASDSDSNLSQNNQNTISKQINFTA